MARVTTRAPYNVRCSYAGITVVCETIAGFCRIAIGMPLCVVGVLVSCAPGAGRTAQKRTLWCSHQYDIQLETKA